VVGQIENERNFHIFYQLTKGASAAHRDSLGIQDPSSYAYISRAKCLDVPGVDDVADFSETLRAMSVIGLSQSEQESILRQLATILWLGNVQFSPDQDGNSYISDESIPNFVSYLMEVDANMVSKCLTSRTIETARGGRRGSVYDVPLNPTQAASVRDALAKAIYNNLFEWIVSRINVSMKSKAGAAQHVVGVLDIYGFEIFEVCSPPP
jgi:myosin-1